ncbi:uncharacterized protein RB166_010022 [Leptodactylus fuscus]|uniref:uncharacterized protein LOC142204661 n=1 Tax=Leptodactylus fuscus TaxID=238119 RepID=UPI003F4EB08D
MVLRLQAAMEKALKKLDQSSYQRFIEKLSVWEVKEEYKNIQKDELMGKDPEHVAGLIYEYYGDDYGAEVTLAVLEDIDEKIVQDELRCDLWKKNLLANTPEAVAKFSQITEISNSLEEALWHGRRKQQWLKRIAKIPPITESANKSLLGNTWNDRMKTTLVGIPTLIPPFISIPVGIIISLLLKAFWPESEKDVWSLIKDQAQGLLDESILEFELQERNNEIRGLQRTMQMYVKAGIKEKGALMSLMIHASNELFYKLTNSKNSVQLIPLVVTHSTQHLLILKERLVHGKEMYDEDNAIVWRNDLENQISSYKEYMQGTYSQWVEWRKSKITIELGVHHLFPYHKFQPYGVVHDEITKVTVNYKYSGFGPNDRNYFKPICEAVKQNMFSFRNGELLKVMVTTFYFDNFIPGKEDNPSVIPPSMSIASFGPISPDLQGGNQRARLYAPPEDNPFGWDVSSINVRAGDVIDGFQVIYSTHNGSFVGNSAGGNLHQIPLNNRCVESIRFGENYCNIVDLTIGFSNGESSGRLGNGAGWDVASVTAGGIPSFGLYNVRAAAGGYCYLGLFQISLDFRAYPARPSEMSDRKLRFVDFTQEKFQYKSVIDVEEME